MVGFCGRCQCLGFSLFGGTVVLGRNVEGESEYSRKLVRSFSMGDLRAFSGEKEFVCLNRQLVISNHFLMFF
jgi:hypothetical protein